MRIHTFKRVKVKGKIESKRVGVGTGVVIDASAGLVITNEHVVAPGQLWVVEPTQEKPMKAKMIGADKATDLALLQADLKNVPAIQFADSAVLEVGDLVFAVGYPFGFDQTVSVGIISGLNRRGFSDSSKEVRVEDFIQTDAAINKGNSGGPLIDSAGKAVGINTFIWSKSGENAGLAFSVPSRIVVAVSRQLRRFGQVRRGALGVTFDTLTPDSAKALGIDVDSGALLTKVHPNSPASQAGLQVGDVITGAGRQRIESASDFLNFLRLVPASEPVSLYVRRGPEVLRVEAVLQPLGGKQGKSKRSATPSVTGSEPSNAFYGATFAARPQVISPGSGASGVSVARVQKGSIAHSRGLKVADVVTHVNRQPIVDMAAFRTVMRTPGTAILTVSRGQSSFLVILSH